MRIQPFLASILFGIGTSVVPTTMGDDLETLQGKWSVHKTNEQGQAFEQVIEFKQDKFTFRIKGDDGNTYLYAEGGTRLERLNPFKSVAFLNIKAGASESDLQEVNDDRKSVYVLGDDTLTLASNFDKERPQPPSLDVYKRLKAEIATLVIEDVVMEETPQSGSWYVCFEATVNGVTRKYHVANRGYDKTPAAVPADLQLPGVRKGETCTFRCQLDDVDDDVCTDEVDNRSTGSFVISDRGSQSYKPEDRWRYTIHWHFK